MKLKDTGFFQQHIEKVVLLVGAVFLLILAAITFVGNPYAIDVGSQSVSPRDAESRLVNDAARLEARLRAEDEDGLASTIRTRDIPDYPNDFVTTLGRRVVDAERYGISFGLPGLATTLFRDIEDPDPYYVPRPPVPDNATARAGYGVLGDAESVEVQRQLTRHVLDPDTGDFRYVSVIGTFDMADYVERLQRNAPAGYQRLPEGWWRAMRGVAGVYLQRETHDPVTGAWGDRQIIEPLPTQIAHGIGAEDPRWNPEDAGAAVTLIHNNQQAIVRPDFVPMAGPHAWVPPDQARRELSAEDHQELSNINAQIQNRQRNITNWSEQLRRMGGEPPVERNRRDPQRPAGPEDWWMQEDRQPDRQPARQRNGAASRQQQEITEQIESEMERLRELERQRDAIYGIAPEGDDADRDPRREAVDDEWEMRRMEEEAEDVYGQRDPRRASRRRGGQETATPLPTGDVQIWAHDLTAEPGRTYRYRIIVTVLNPLFQRSRLADEQTEAYFNKLALGPDEAELEQTPWSDPVQLDPEYYFFLVDGAPAREEARVEVWRLYRGLWHVEEFEVRPGDQIGGEVTIDQQPVAMRVNSLLVDLVPASESASGGRGARMIYLDRDTNRIGERIADIDRESDDRIRLRNELERTSEMANRSVAR